MGNLPFISSYLIVSELGMVSAHDQRALGYLMGVRYRTALQVAGEN
jgi:hypothetical protein